MGNRRTELLAEISQLFEQYRQEVPGRRRAWPESIRRRVLELRQLGLNFTQIAKQTGLPYYTLLSWRRESKAGHFEPVNVVSTEARSKQVATVTVATSGKEVATAAAEFPSKSATVTVSLGSGIRVEGVTLPFLMELLAELGVAAR